MKMNTKRKSPIFILLFLALLAPAVFGQEARLSVNKTGRKFRIKRGAKLLFTVSANKKDEAFPAGKCVIVRRNVRATELFPEVERLEIFDQKGKKKTYFEKNLNIRRLNDWRIFTSSDHSWSVIPDEEEGTLSGFFLISAECAIKEIGFPTDSEISWGDFLGGQFTDNSTLLLSGLELVSAGKTKKVAVKIKRNGTFNISDE